MNAINAAKSNFTMKVPLFGLILQRMRILMIKIALILFLCLKNSR
jgi:hypothetical protein